MKRGKKLIGVGVAVILGLSLILVPMVSRVSPAQAAVTWTYPVEVTLDSELYVVDAWVIKESATSYKMWYTHGKKDLTISEIIDGVTALDLDALITDITSLDLEGFLSHLNNLDVSKLKDLLDSTRTVIGYATSTDGKTWAVQNSQALVGSSSAAWDSVGAPCVIWDATANKYKMWYTRIKTDLTQTSLQTILTGIADPDPATRKAAILDLLNSTGTVIDYATWDGVSANWTVEDAQVLPVSSDVGVWGSVADSCVIKNSDTDYEMWYTRAKTDITQTDLNTILTNIDTFGIDDLLGILDGTATVIGYATSSDGITWTVPDAQVLPVSSDVGAWSSVADPSVVKTGSSYEMWYTNVKTNLNEGSLHTLASAIGGLDIAALWNTLKTQGISEFITDLVALDIDAIKSVLSGTSTVIGYATSSDGVNWTVQNPQDLVGSSGSPWSSVAAPSVVKTGSTYEMWYTEGIDDLTWQNLIDLVFGDNLPIGYAYYIPIAPPPPPPSGITDVSDYVTAEGVFTETTTAESFDGLAYLTIDEGTIGLTEEGEPLSEISMVEMAEPPPPPEDSNVIGLFYDFGPDRATFDPPITLTFTYDPSLIPEGVAEENLVIAVWLWDEEAGEYRWVNLVCIVDPEANTITAKVSHFTAFTILAYTRPAVFIASNLSITPAEVDIGEEVTITALITNTGDLTGSYEATLKIDNVVVATKEVTLAGHASQRVTFTTAKDVAGTYTVNVNGQSDTFTVKTAPVPAAFTLSSLTISPTEVDMGEEITISVLITNTGDLTGSYEATLKIDNVVVATKEVTLVGGASQRVTFTTAKDIAGTYTVTVDGLSGTFEVKVPPLPPKPINWWLIGGIIAGVIIIGVVVWQVVVRRRA